MELDREALKRACLSIARGTMWRLRPVDNEEIDQLAAKLSAIAIGQVKYREDTWDPNIVTRAVSYLSVLAIPPMRDDTRWFEEMLQVLLELACPSTCGNAEHEAFYRDIEKGLAKARASYE